MTIAVVDYGIGNLRSAEKALQHLGADARLTPNAADIASADAVVLPGVGNFGACMRALRDSGLERVTIDASDESPDAKGLGVVPGRITRLPGTVRLPQMGWNTLEARPGARLLAGLPDPAWCYFVHTYAPEPDDESVVAAWCEYGRRFAAAVEIGPLWATQFHPEKSGAIGMAMLANFVKAVAA